MGDHLFLRLAQSGAVQVPVSKGFCMFLQSGCDYVCGNNSVYCATGDVAANSSS